MFLLDVYRRKVEFPDLKRAVRELAALHGAKIVLVEDKASGLSLIQELRAEHFSLVQAAPAIDGDKVMRLRAQTAKIEGGFVLFPTQAHWLEAYLLELVGFPNSKTCRPITGLSSSVMILKRRARLGSTRTRTDSHSRWCSSATIGHLRCCHHTRNVPSIPRGAAPADR